MPRKARRQFTFTTTQKASILRRHFVDKVAISDLGRGLSPSLKSCFDGDMVPIALLEEALRRGGAPELSGWVRLKHTPEVPP